MDGGEGGVWGEGEGLDEFVVFSLYLYGVSDDACGGVECRGDGGRVFFDDLVVEELALGHGGCFREVEIDVGVEGLSPV